MVSNNLTSNAKRRSSCDRDVQASATTCTFRSREHNSAAVCSTHTCACNKTYSHYFSWYQCRAASHVSCSYLYAKEHNTFQLPITQSFKFCSNFRHNHAEFCFCIDSMCMRYVQFWHCSTQAFGILFCHYKRDI